MLRSSIVLLISALALGQQPNTAAASMTVDGVSGPPYPIATSVRTNTTATVAVSGAAGAPFIIALSATGTAQPGAALTGGGLVDLPLVPAPVIGAQAALDASGVFQLSVLVPPPGTPPAGIPIGHQEALQAAVSDPLSPAGFTLTALTQVSVIQGPIVVNLALGSDGVASINLAPHGFSIPFYGASYNADLALRERIPHVRKPRLRLHSDRARVQHRSPAHRRVLERSRAAAGHSLAGGPLHDRSGASGRPAPVRPGRMDQRSRLGRRLAVLSHVLDQDRCARRLQALGIRR